MWKAQGSILGDIWTMKRTQSFMNGEGVHKPCRQMLQSPQGFQVGGALLVVGAEYPGESTRWELGNWSCPVQTCVLSTWNVASATEELSFKLYLVSIDLNSSLWLLHWNVQLWRMTKFRTCQFYKVLMRQLDFIWHAEGAWKDFRYRPDIVRFKLLKYFDIYCISGWIGIYSLIGGRM